MRWARPSLSAASLPVARNGRRPGGGSRRVPTSGIGGGAAGSGGGGGGGGGRGAGTSVGGSDDRGGMAAEGLTELFARRLVAASRIDASAGDGKVAKAGTRVRDLVS